MSGRAAAENRRWSFGEAVLVLVAAVLVYWPLLGRGGFTATEGHRVVPAWEMLDRGDWLIPRMFGQIYLRKPPGIFWAIASLSEVLGRTELAARAVSALAASALALAAYHFATRWFGRPWGLWAGLAQALLPVMWESGRSAEIEALNALGIVVAMLAIVDLLVRPATRSAAGDVGLGLLAGAGLFLAGVAKGPVAIPFVAAAAVGACVAERSARGLARPGVWIGLGASGAALGAVALAVRGALEGAEGPVLTQGVGDFLWGGEPLTAERLGRVAMLCPAVLLTGLPASLALGPALGRGGGQREDRLARALALGCALSVIVLMVLGVHNPRYGLPAAAATPVLVGYALRRVARGSIGARGAGIARALRVSRPAWWAVALLLGAVVWIGVLEPRERSRSGREAGIELAALLRDGDEVIADHLIAARPEVLLYARREAAASGREVIVRWSIPAQGAPEPPPPGSVMVLRTDELSGEEALYRESGALDRAELIGSGRVHKYTYAVYRAERP